MAKCTTRENSHTGTYRYENTQIEVFPFFLYEVSLWVRWKNGCAILGSKFIKSNNLIPKVVKSKKMKSYTIEANSEYEAKKILANQLNVPLSCIDSYR